MLRVLCVDDEKLILRQIADLCRKIPEISETQSFDRAGKALSWLGDHPCDLALLDINMPDMDGLTLARKIQEIRPGTHIVFVTGYPQYAADSWRIHPAGYLLKPVAQKDLQGQVDYILSLHSSCRQA